MSLKVDVKHKLEETFPSTEIKETEKGFKVHTDKLKHWELRMLEYIDNMILQSEETSVLDTIEIKRSGTGLTILITVQE